MEPISELVRAYNNFQTWEDIFFNTGEGKDEYHGAIEDFDATRKDLLKIIEGVTQVSLNDIVLELKAILDGLASVLENHTVEGAPMLALEDTHIRLSEVVQKLGGTSEINSEAN